MKSGARGRKMNPSQLLPDLVTSAHLSPSLIPIPAVAPFLSGSPRKVRSEDGGGRSGHGDWVGKAGVQSPGGWGDGGPSWEEGLWVIMER